MSKTEVLRTYVGVRSVRVPDAEWQDLSAATAMGSDRAKVINQLIAWWLRRSGTTLPARPDPALIIEITRRSRNGEPRPRD